MENFKNSYKSSSSVVHFLDAMSQFNGGAQGKYHLFETLNLTVGVNTKQGLSSGQRNRLNKVATKVSAKDKRR